ncbi:MAG: alpha-galactosidase [Spirochaetota bacterium]
MNIITLNGYQSSYAILPFENSLPLHVHWGAKTRFHGEKKLFPFNNRDYSIRPQIGDTAVSIEELQFEYGFAENGDFRRPAFRIRDGRNYPITGPFELTTHSYRGKNQIPGLPSARTGRARDIETLELQMYDSKSGVQITLFYSMFPEYDAVCRHVRFTNKGGEPVKLEKAATISMDLFNWDYELINLPGAWARERQLQRRPLQIGTTSFGSTRGTSSHQFNPSFALVSPDNTELSGEAYGFSLIYSGNFLAELELNHDNNLRINLGIHPDTFEWQLPPGESFCTPEAVMIYSNEGLNGMSGKFHGFIREHIFPAAFRERERPILFNNWEATYFDFNQQDLTELGEMASDLGAELFVLDDGWFGRRDSDRSSLGDWQVNTDKLPGGLKGLSKAIEQRGLQFGLWLEPEMISKNSQLAGQHPDWFLSIPDRPLAEGRNQLVLDLSRQEICDFLVDTLDEILASAPIRYIKWDMNRYLTNVAAPQLADWQQREVYHRYILGLYQVLDRLTARHPQVLFEGCSGGGGRFDLGILYYMPQYWTSDNTDAVSRVRIQYGTSLFYPPVSMGAHVSAVPNHQVGRSTSLEIRGHVAMSGNFGYELDLRALAESEREQIKAQIAFYKTHRRLLQFGRFIRLQSPFESSHAAWMFLCDEYFLLFWFRLQAEANLPSPRVKLAGLDPAALYTDESTGYSYTGGELMYRGLFLPQPEGDYVSQMLLFHRQ